jgi:putative acyl-CoA dehydrogenase
MSDRDQVFNQPPPLEGYDAFISDRALVEGVRREGAEWADEALSRMGQRTGSADAITWGFEANQNPPTLRTYDRFGDRLDRVDYHPSYHRLMEVAVGEGLHALPWRDGRRGAHVARAAGFYLWSQVDAGHGCPISMTYSVVPALRAADSEGSLFAEWTPRLMSREYDPRYVPASAKRGALAGMGMTEKQGGSDVRANITRAEPAASEGETAYRLFGHKWFCSAPMSDVFLMLAQAPGGLSCFVVPRFGPDGDPNGLRFQRLKDKLGNRSNASGEVELDGASARLLGEEGRGVATVIEMVNHTRLDCAIGAASGMRQAVAQATHHAAHRAAFGSTLTDQPLMRAVLADLSIESEAATLTMLRLAGAFDRAAGGDRSEAAFRRLATAVGKYWLCKRHPAVAAEALECLGGNGYVEESILPRLFRESPLNGIWEGSGNVICLDVLRAAARSAESVEVFLAELDASAGADRRLDEAVRRLRREIADPHALESRARRVVEAMALALQGSLLVRYGDPAVADAFCASRLAGDWGRAFGTLPASVDNRTIVERARPKVV